MKKILKIIPIGKDLFLSASLKHSYCSSLGDMAELSWLKGLLVSVLELFEDQFVQFCSPREH